MGRLNKPLFYILCGGEGTRLWPLSTSSKPKPFLPIFSGESLFSMTCKRLKGMGAETKAVIQERYVKFISGESYLLEPSTRNTAPAIALSVISSEADDVIGFFPADHNIKNIKIFNRAVENAVAIAEKDNLIVTLGVSPDCANTGYGYIHCEDLKDGWGRVSAFKEKPDYNKACDYIRDGGYFWNAGIFIGKRGIFLEEMQKHCMDIIQSVKRFWRLKKSDIYDAINPISIDYALMEKSEIVAMVPLSGSGWSDVGHFENLYSILPQNKNGNVLIGDVEVDDCKKCLIVSFDKKISARKLSDFIIANSEEGSLCRPFDQSLIVERKH